MQTYVLQPFLSVRNNNTSRVTPSFLLGPGEYNVKHIPFRGISEYEERK